VTSIAPSLTQTTTYYAEARNTTTSCVSSSRLSVSGIVNQYGIAGSAPGTCGCASGLLTCSGLCQATCGNFTVCAGITEMTTATVDGNDTQSVARSTCQAMGTGWRLPSNAEAACICANKTIIPGKYGTGPLWTNETTGSYAYSLSTYDCSFATSALTAKWPFKCVK
jgi:hypothetical protein